MRTGLRDQRLRSLLLALTLWGGEPAEAREKIKETHLCPRFVIHGPEELSFTEPERLLMCGNPQSAVWNRVPDNQAIFHLRTFLQDHGYFNPKVEVRGNRIFVDLGEPSIARSLRTEGDPKDLPIEHLRDIVGTRLTPKLLDTARDRIRHMLESRGYPCPNTKMEADPDTGEIVAHLDAGPRQNVIKVKEDSVEGLAPNMMSRYWAFVLGAPYNGDLTTVTSRRITNQGLVQSTFFTASCTPDGAVLRQQTVPGPARLVTIGAGIDTEQGPMLRASWKNTRLGASGSLINLTANSSLRIQEFTADGAWYWKPYPTRSFLQPTFDIKRDSEQHYTILTGTARFAPATTWDNETLGADLSLGPTLTWTHTYQGEGPPDAKFMSVNATGHLHDHYWEYYQNSPRSGFNLSFEGQWAQKDWLSPVSARMIRTNLEALLNVGQYDPPFLVFGFRGGLWTTFTDENLYVSNALPTIFRQFLGGSTDMRGFGRQELPGSSGALSAAWGSLELRFADLLPFGIQPFTFVDAGLLGMRNFTLDSPLFWDPGIGIRWQAPFGVIRTTLAHGFLNWTSAQYSPKLSHYQFYFSFGEEF